MESEKKRILEKEAVLHCHKEQGYRFTLAAVFNDKRAEYDIGIAIFNKKDKNFRKIMGKSIALGRAVRRPIFHVPKESAEKAGSVVDILKSLEADLRKNKLREVYQMLKTVTD